MVKCVMMLLFLHSKPKKPAHSSAPQTRRRANTKTKTQGNIQKKTPKQNRQSKCKKQSTTTQNQIVSKKTSIRFNHCKQGY